MSLNIEKTNKKRVVVIGGGIGGLRLIDKLKKSDFQIILFDRNDYHQFPPLIYQVASGGLEASSISFPYRKLFGRDKDIHFRMGTLRAVFPESHLIQTSVGRISYDYLVLAAGTTTDFKDNEQMEKDAFPMKTVSEAMGLQNALLSNLEKAASSTSEEEQKELLNIVIVGDGVPGVEIAGAVAEMRKSVFPHDYPGTDPSLMHVSLIGSSARLLPTFSRKSGETAEKYLTKMGVTVMHDSPVADYRDNKVILKDGTEMPTRSLIWVNSFKAQAVGNLNPQHIGNGFRIKVNQFNQAEGLSDIYCIGDQCIMSGDSNYPNGHPQVAQAAIQQATNLAMNLKRRERGEEMMPFRYKKLGVMASIGRNKAVAEVRTFRLKGFPAWILCHFVRLKSVSGVRNKLIVLFNWTWNYMNHNRSLRMIFYPGRAQEVQDSEQQEAHSHWKEDVSGKERRDADAQEDS